MNTKPYPWYKKINPLWWFGNANDPIDGKNADGTPAHPRFYPDKPTWIRKILWFFRNPFHNLFFFVIGFHDRPDVVNAGNQWPKPGQKWNIVMPYVCYQGKKWEWYFGWRKGLSFGAAFRTKDSKPM